MWFGPVVSAAEERELIDQLVVEHGVGVCCWPRDAERIAHLAAANVPRLLLVRSGAVPPAPAAQQAWVESAAGHDEIHEALHALWARATSPAPEQRLEASRYQR